MATGYFTHPDCARHHMGDGHPECPERLAAIEDRLIASGLADFLTRLEAPVADLAAINRAHASQHILALADQHQILLRDHAAGGPDHVYLDPDTALCTATWDAARRSAGAAIAATDAVIDGALDNAFCAVRPPGHHATHAQAMGFCFFNNVAIAAKHALDARGLQRVAVIDFDVHHGNGTEDIFGAHLDERVLMCSFFQHPFYPYSGTEQPAPNMVNVPVPAYSRGAVVRELVEQQWLPRLEAFKPEMIFISAGFDAHREDDLGQMGLVEADYAWITECLQAVAQRHAKGRIVSCLEGGYNLDALGRSVAAHVKVLAGA
jgi:acetoin utilization deacetylase AcuC-like enzyme